MSQQEFEGIDDSLRLQLEWARVGSYIQIETKCVPCEFIENLDPLISSLWEGCCWGRPQAGVCDCAHLVSPLVQVYTLVKRPSHPLSWLAVVPDPPSLLQVGGQSPSSLPSTLLSTSTATPPLPSAGMGKSGELHPNGDQRCAV